MRYGALVTLGMLFATLGVAPVRVSLNEKPLAATAVVRNGRVLLPFRLIFGALHASVSYEARTHWVRARRGNDRIALRIGTHDSVLLAEHLYVPVRYVSESLGAHVQYDSVDRIVFISDSQKMAGVAQSPLAVAGNAPDAPATPPPGYQPPVPYATDNGYPAYSQPMNFYIPGNRYTYYPGERLQFILDAPPGGTAYVQMCGIGRIQFNNPPGSTQYFLTFYVPDRLSGHACEATAYYIGALGAQRSIILPASLQFPATPSPSPTASPTPAPTPRPSPTPGTTRVILPVGRIPQSSATPAPTARPVKPKPKPKPKPTPSERPQG